RFRRSRMGAPIWWTEALFPGYVFARFSYFQKHRQVRALTGVSTIVRFGDQPASLADEAMSALREAIGPSGIVEIAGVAEAASEVLIVEGPLRGLQVLVTRVLPARQRVAVLLEFLGATREVEIHASSVIPANPRAPSGTGVLGRETGSGSGGAIR
ncbi:MAG: transcription termination/antitermination NusG family protein, partial [Chthoniobacterales bacterium]